MLKLARYFLFFLLISLTGCHEEKKFRIQLYQGFRFEAGQKYELVLNDGDYSKKQEFRSPYRENEYKRIGIYRTNSDSIKVYFKIDSKDTLFYIPSDHTKRIVFGSTAYGKLNVGTDKEPWYWERQ